MLPFCKNGIVGSGVVAVCCFSSSVAVCGKVFIG